jgi:hypothetical protein
MDAASIPGVLIAATAEKAALTVEEAFALAGRQDPEWRAPRLNPPTASRLLVGDTGIEPVTSPV